MQKISILRGRSCSCVVFGDYFEVYGIREHAAQPLTGHDSTNFHAHKSALTGFPVYKGEDTILQVYCSLAGI